MTTVDVSKLTGYAVGGGEDDAVTETKLNGYAVSGGFDDKVTLTKLVGYVVLDAPVRQPQLMIIN